MESEFSSLCDLALARGVKHSELISEIDETVIAEYQKQYPDKEKEIDVVVDEKTGEVRLMSGKTDVTPNEFASTAASLARKVVIEKMMRKYSETGQI